MTEFTTLKPTGKPAWPLILLAGVEGAGKSWTAAEASALDLFGQSFFLEVGERMADEYGAIPGANYEIIQHDGSERQIIQAAQWAAQQPTIDGKPNLLIIDSMTEVWQVIQDEQQAIANRRAQAKGRGSNRDATITMDQWNVAKDHFNDLLMAARRFPGPVIMTARLDNVSVVEGGQPTGEKIWKVRSEKNLPYAATVIVQAREPRHWTLTKIASRILQLPPEGAIQWNGFTIEELLVRMEIDSPAAVVDSTYVRPKANEAQATSVDKPQSDDAPVEAPGDLPPMPDDIKGTLAAAESALDLPAIEALGRVVAANDRAGTAGARVAKARVEGAWKRVNARLKAGERPAGEESQDTPEPEMSCTGMAPEEEGGPSDPPAEPQTTDEPSSSAPEEDASSPEPTSTPSDDSEPPAQREQPAQGTFGDMPEPKWGTNTDSGQPIHDPAKRKDSKRRTGILSALEDELPRVEGADTVDDLVYMHIGLEADQASTDALQDVLTTVTKAAKAS